MLTALADRQITFLDSAMRLVGFTRYSLESVQVRDHDHLRHVLVKFPEKEIRLISLDQMMGFMEGIIALHEQQEIQSAHPRD